MGESHRSLLTKPMKKIFIVLMLISLFLNLDVFAADENTTLSVDVVKSLIETDTGIESLVSLLEKNKKYMKENKPFYYYYISAVKSYVVDSDYKMAEEQFRLSLEQAENSGNPQEEGLAIRGLIDLNNCYGDIAMLIDYGSRLLQLGQKNNQPDMIIEGAYSIASGHYYIFDDSKVIEYLDMGATKAFNTNNKIAIAQFYNMMGELTYSQKNYEASRGYFKNVQEQLATLDSNNRMVRSMNFISKAMPLIIDSIEGKPRDLTLQKSTELLESSQKYIAFNKELLINLYAWNAEIYKNYKMIPETIINYEKGLEIAKKIKHIDTQIDPYQSYKLKLALAYHEIGEYEKSSQLYVNQARQWEKKEFLKKNENNITEVKSLGEEQLKEKIDMLNKLKIMSEEKIIMQKKALNTSLFFIALLAVGLFFIAMEYRRIVTLKKRIYLQSITDSLTQVYNRGRIVEIMETELMAENKIAIIDIDDFKQINDTYGHAVGDEVIVGIVNAIKKSLRATDVIGRYGGEEFVLILKQVDDNDALKVIERVRQDVEAIEWPYAGLKTTVSIGMMKKCNMSTDKLFISVDQLLYEAKRSGKNRVVYKHS